MNASGETRDLSLSHHLEVYSRILTELTDFEVRLAIVEQKRPGDAEVAQLHADIAARRASVIEAMARLRQVDGALTASQTAWMSVQ